MPLLRAAVEDVDGFAQFAVAVELSTFQVAHLARDAIHVIAEKVRGESKAGIIGQPQSLLKILKLHHWDHRAKDFVPHDRHLLANSDLSRGNGSARTSLKASVSFVLLGHPHLDLGWSVPSATLSPYQSQDRLFS